MKSKTEYMVRRIQKHLKTAKVVWQYNNMIVRESFVYKGKNNSIQASGEHYCSPKKSNANFYTHVEVYVERGLKSLEMYNGGDNTYMFVPIHLVAKALVYD